MLVRGELALVGARWLVGLTELGDARLDGVVRDLGAVTLGATLAHTASEHGLAVGFALADAGGIAAVGSADGRCQDERSESE